MSRNDKLVDVPQFVGLVTQVPSEQIPVLWRQFQKKLKADPNDTAALYGSHILMWRQGRTDEAVDFFHRLLIRTPSHFDLIHNFTGHLQDRRELERLAHAYVRRYPADPGGYLMNLVMLWTVFRFEQIRKVIRQLGENASQGVHFQPSVIASIFDAARGAPYTSFGDVALVEQCRARYSARRFETVGDGSPRATAWTPLEIGDRFAVLAAAVGNVGNDVAVTFRVSRADAPAEPPIEVVGKRFGDGRAAGRDGRCFRATVEGLLSGVEYRFVVHIGGATTVAADGGAFRTLGSEPPEAITEDAEPTGRRSIALNGTVAGATLPTRYHFRYGKSPKSLRRRTPSHWLPPGRDGRVREAGENTYRRLVAYGMKVSFVHAGTGEANADAKLPRCLAAMKMEWPFGKDRNHMNGIGVIDLLAGWQSRAHLRGHVPTAFDARTFPKPAYPGEAVDFRDALFSVAYRAEGFDAKAFHPIAWIHAGTGEALESERCENLAPWAHTGGFGSRSIIGDGQWHRLSFQFDCDSRDWTFAGNNTEEMGPAIARYTYFPLGTALGESRNGNICICFAFGDELDTPEGDIELGELELAYRSHSLLLPSQGTALVAWPAGTTCDPGLLTGGWLGDLDHCWQDAGGRTGAKEFVWRFRDTAIIRSVRLHQHPVWPAKEVEITVSNDGTDFRTLWTGDMKDIPTDPADWNVWSNFGELSGMVEVKVFEPAAQARFFRLRLLSGHREDGIGLDAVEAFGDAPAPLPSPEPCNVCEEIGRVGPGAIFAQLVAENAAGRAEGEIVRISLPSDDRPFVTAAEVIRRTETGAAVRVRANAMGVPASVVLRLKAGRGKTIVSPKVPIGKWSVTGDAVIRVDGLKPGLAYRGSVVAANRHGKSKPFSIAIGTVAAERAAQSSHVA